MVCSLVLNMVLLMMTLFQYKVIVKFMVDLVKEDEEQDEIEGHSELQHHHQMRHTNRRQKGFTK